MKSPYSVSSYKVVEKYVGERSLSILKGFVFLGLVDNKIKAKKWEELSLSYQESRDRDQFGEHLPLNIIIHMKIPDFIWVSSLLVYGLPQRLFGGFYFLFTNFYPQCYSACIHFRISSFK